LGAVHLGADETGFTGAREMQLGGVFIVALGGSAANWKCFHILFDGVIGQHAHNPISFHLLDHPLELLFQPAIFLLFLLQPNPEFLQFLTLALEFLKDTAELLPHEC
jgi:hypothetical protein